MMATTQWESPMSLNPGHRKLAREQIAPYPQRQRWGSSVTSVLECMRAMAMSSQKSRALLVVLRKQLADAMKQEVTRHASSGTASPRERTDRLDCPYCEGFMAQPVCLPCGHSLCKSCIEKTVKLGDVLCPKCMQPVPKVSQSNDYFTNEDGTQSRRATVILQNLFQKLYPQWVKSCKYREEGNMFANEGDFPLAIHWYDKAISTGTQDHRVLGNRSRSYLAMNKLDEALQDAEDACKIKPLWKKGHFRRATVLEKLGRWLEAVAAYLLCLFLGGNDQSLVSTIVCQLIDAHASEFTMSEWTFCVLVHQNPGHCLDQGDSSDSSSLLPTISTIVKLCLCMMREAGVMREAGEMWEGVKRVEPVQLDSQDLECSLCTALIFDPVTTVCGHSFCRSCLCRSFDHSPACPVCRTVLSECFHAFCQKSGQMNVDETLDNILQLHFPQHYQEKKSQLETEALHNYRVGTSELELLPIFVCTVAFPGMPCPLHVFEPRYRLMIRRCLESGSRRFGMCQPARDNGNEHSFSEYGTVLHVNSVEYTPDGRSLVKAVGERRFKVVGREMIDGYHSARVQFLFDVRVTDPEEIESLRNLQEEVYLHAKKWLNALPMPVRILLMHNACSPLPPLENIPECCPNGPMWLWWYIHVIPITPQRKQEMYTCWSLRRRLLILKEVLPVTHQMS